MFNIGRRLRDAATGRSLPHRDVTLTIATPGSRHVASALAEATVVVKPQADWSGPEEAGLALSFTGIPAPFRTRIALGGGASELVLAVHTHLLPNGKVKAELLLLGPGEAVLGRATAGLQVDNSGALAEAVRSSLRRSGTPLVLAGPCDSSLYDYADLSLRPWFDRPDALGHIRAVVAGGAWSEDEGRWLEGFVTNGFLVAEDLIEPDLLAQIRAELDDAAAKKIQGFEWGSSQRIENLHQRYPGIRTLWMHPKVIRLLSCIFESEPRPCQTLTFIFGSQQDLHQDTVHLTPFPAGYMCGVWIAIDHVVPDSGELAVLKGSHRLPRTYMRDIDCPKVVANDWTPFGERMLAHWVGQRVSGEFERIIYRPKAGSVLIWHENLMHGGSPRIDPSLTRRSIVSHFFADGSIAYYDSTGKVGHLSRPDAG